MSGTIWFAHDLRLSRHARRRFKERTGLPIRAADTTAGKALMQGKAPNQLPPHLESKLLNSLARNQSHDKTAFARVYRGFAYVFAAGVDLSDPHLLLITVLPGYDDAAPVDDYMFPTERPTIRNKKRHAEVHTGKGDFKRDRGGKINRRKPSLDDE